MAMYQDAKGNYVSGEGPGNQYNYVNTNGQYVNNSGSSGPVYSPATQQQQQAAGYRPPSYSEVQGITTAAGANPNGSGAAVFNGAGGTAAGYRKADGTIVYGAGNADELADIRKTIGGVAYTPNVGIPAATPSQTPQGFSFSGVTMPQAYNPNAGAAYMPTGAMPQNGVKTVQAPPTAMSSVTTPQLSNTQGMAYSPTGGSMGNNYGSGAFEQAQFGYPGMPTQTSGSAATAPFKSAYDATAAQKSAAEQATARIAQMKLGVQQGVDKYNTSRTNAYDYTNQTTKDNRVLAASMFNRNSNPFSGGTDYKQAQILRSNNLEDTAANNNYQADLSASNQKLLDFSQAAPEQQQAMYDQILQQLQSTANQQDQIALQARGQDMNQTNADKQYGLSQAQLALQQQGQAYNQSYQDRAFNQNQANADRSFNQTTNQNQFNNNLATNQQNLTSQNQAFNQQQQVKKEHTDLANTLSQMFNKYVYPTDDPMLSYAQVAGLPTATAQKLAQDAKNTDFDNAIKLALSNNTITQTQASILNQAQQIKIGQQNADTSTTNAGNSAASKLTDQLLDSWKASGRAPAGLEKLGVQPGQAYSEGTAGKVKVNDVISQLSNSTFVKQSTSTEFDESGMPVSTKRPVVYDAVGLAKSILSRGLSDSDIDYALRYFNIDEAEVKKAADEVKAKNSGNQ